MKTRPERDEASQASLTLLVNQDGLFQRATNPREIHVWTSSLDGADQAMAERIAGSVDAK